MPTPSTVFAVSGDAVVPTELSRGPWNPGAQHGGAPAGLLVAMADRALEQEPGWVMARLTLEFLRPVPVAPLRAQIQPQPGGGSVRRLSLELWHGDVLVVSGTALYLRERELGLFPTIAAPILPGPDMCRDPIRIPGMAEQVSFHYTAMESRVAGGDVGAPGPAAAWFRFAVPLVQGWPASAAARAVAAADFGNGLSWTVPLEDYVFANADLTVYLHRLPRGEWVAVDASTTVQANGLGLTRSVLHDEGGPIGLAQQALVIKPR